MPSSRSQTRILAPALLVLLAPLAFGEVAERVLAVVDSRPVLLSEVRALERLRKVDRAQATQAMIDERLMFREAARVPQSALSADEDERAYRSLVERWPADAAASEVELRRLARREATILKYLEFRFRSQVRAADDEIRAAYAERYAAAPDAPPLDSVSATLADEIEARKFDERIEAWVRELRAGAEIRLNP